LGIATTVKLARALWILPLAVATAAVRRAPGGRAGQAPVQIPRFVGLFVLAALCATYVAAGAPLSPRVVKAARVGPPVTLSLIGTGISRRTLRQGGPRSLLQGSLLWLAVSGVSLWLIRAGWIRL